MTIDASLIGCGACVDAPPQQGGTQPPEEAKHDIIIWK